VADETGPRTTVPARARAVVPVTPRGPGRAARPSAPLPRLPPPRPVLTSDLPPPARSPEAAAPTALRISAALWFAACAAGLFGLLAALTDGAALRERLTATATAQDPAVSAAVVDDGVRATILLVLGVVTLLTVLDLACTALILRRRSWARWVLGVTGLLTLFAVDVTQSVVTGGVDLDRFGFLTQAGFVLLGLIPLFAPSTGSWLRGAD
jgi:hypothetical protein